MVANKQSDYPDDTRGILRSDIVRPHRTPTTPIRPLTPESERGRSGDLHGGARRAPRLSLEEEERLNKIAAAGTQYLGMKPVPNITPNYGPTENGKREYELQLTQDLVHGGYHSMHAVLGCDGGGQVQREDGGVVPLTGGQRGIQYRNTISLFHFSFEEIVQLACCACDARGMSWSDACRFIEQTLQNMQDRSPEGA